ncbi:MAG: hypothetical protein A3H70_03330 [Candidatus Komeilibacteria bacterium RIFCSPLOWO2_02_FULL_48_11]|uniref:Uncharacterized protein n=1 Tax=Candidatus Komeilibacteria bacterium RIFCSPLOWO2_02_FULL_48_11 TaxID=1798553 RepID=A0A1G2BTK5_9BACT|nr:MAG: hypothetical protein A3H70_03330 [Candidatus Komeilibacteria bacterium RIFCSPLOWO2_02_FULL_48_11]
MRLTQKQIQRVSETTIDPRTWTIGQLRSAVEHVKNRLKEAKKTEPDRRERILEPLLSLTGMLSEVLGGKLINFSNCWGEEQLYEDWVKKIQYLEAHLAEIEQALVQ